MAWDVVYDCLCALEKPRAGGWAGARGPSRLCGRVFCSLRGLRLLVSVRPLGRLACVSGRTTAATEVWTVPEPRAARQAGCKGCRLGVCIMACEHSLFCSVFGVCQEPFITYLSENWPAPALRIRSLKQKLKMRGKAKPAQGDPSVKDSWVLMCL